jgi:Protein of unknown function (DUF2013)
MELIATYDASASELDDPQRFWEEVEDLLSTKNVEEQRGERTLEARLTSFYALCDACYDTHLDHQQNSEYLLSRLVDSQLLTESPIDEVAAAITFLAVTAKSLPILLLTYDTLLKLSVRYSDLFKSSPEARQLIPRLVHHFWAARYAEEYNERNNATPAAKQEEDTDHPLSDWNIKHVRSISSGDTGRQMTEQRDRYIQIKLRERSVRLLYEICRSQRLGMADMKSVDATFVNHLFDLVENSRNWHDDTYNYQVIKLIVALNEQFMVSGISAISSKQIARKSTASASNTVLTVLRTRLNASKTFGENVIFMLNRASSLDAEDICMQLLILKLLYLLFTTKETSHYFYTNDLKVLVDIFIRELSDLPEDHESLRHTYLRVLHPLLTNTQLLTYPYKRPQIHRLLVGLTSHGHLRDISATTQRLIDRCLSAQWCVDLDRLDPKKANDAKQKTGEQNHTFSVQTIGGGPATLIQAPAILDSEGVTIPMDKDHKPYLGAPSSDVRTAEVLTAVEPEGIDRASHSRSPTLTLEAFPTENNTYGSNTPKSRTIRIHSVDGLPSDLRSSLNDYSGRIHPDTFSDTDSTSHSNAESRSYDDEQRPKAVRGQGQFSAPKRVHSAIDVTKTRSETESEDESGRWVSSPAESWHQSMSDDQNHSDSALTKTSGLIARSRAGSAAASTVNVGSPLRDSMTAYDLPSMSVPLVHVQEASQTPEHSDDGKGKSSSNVSRRRPPAPPTVDGRGSARQTQLRRLGLHASPSESTLVRPGVENCELDQSGHLSATDALDNSQRATQLNTVSTPATPRNGSQAGSREASRASSPTLPDPPSSSGAGANTGRRRRPPPPPVDRSTKIRQDGNVGNRPILPNSAPHQTVNYAQASQRENNPQLTQYMDHLHLSSEGGYGW